MGLLQKQQVSARIRASLVAQTVESAHSAGDPSLIPGSGKSPAVGNGNPLQYSCLENPMDRGAWRATVYRGPKDLDMTERLTQTSQH